VAAKTYAVVLSDVHIGNGAPTCWYQRSVHEPPLTHVLSWILTRRDVIREVVLLGDVFDVWTYPPSQRPPSMREIIAANPLLLGPTGPLAAVVRALPGQVRMLLGNHDGSLTRADIATLNGSLGGDRSRGERIELVQAPWRVVAGASGARTVFSHGHHWCMFNAPDARSRWATIPVGHFVTRAISYQLSRSLKGSETAADRRNSGNPNGVDLGAALASWDRRDDLVAYLLSYVCRHTGMRLDEPIVMPDGSTTTVREAMRIFGGLFTRWARRGRTIDALRAAAADWRGEDLAWFAHRLAIRTASDLAVMGHTHVPVGGLIEPPANYVNSGYECVARPDAPGKEFTFTAVDLERATAQVLAVSRTPAGTFTVAPARAPAMRSVIRRPWKDYSCYARIDTSDRALKLVRASKDAESHWVVPPPAEIPPYSRADIWLQDSIGLRGSAGRFTYSDGTRTLEFALACPTLSGNVVRSPVPLYRTRTGRSAWRTGGVDRSGYPLVARFFVEPVRTAGVVPAAGQPGGEAEAGELAAGTPRVAARILWPALGFPAVIAPRTAPQGSPDSRHSICVLLLSDRRTLTAEDAARHLRIVPWAERTRRQIGQGQPGSFRATELTVRSGSRLERPQKDKHGDGVVFGGDRYEGSVVASLSRAVREFYARQGLRHLHEIRVSEAASGRLADGQYHLLWNGSAASGPSDEMRMLLDRFAAPRRRDLPAKTEAEKFWLRHNLGFLVDEYRFDYGALHPPYQEHDPGRRFTEVLHPVFVRRQTGSLRIAHLTDTHIDVRSDVYEENLKRAPKPMSTAGGRLFYQGLPVQLNNWNRAFERLYAHAKGDARAILITGDLIDYGRGHVGLVNGGRHRHELAVEGRYHTDRNWFLFYYLLASGSRYAQPVYTILGNHDWRLNPYPPFAPGAPSPEALVHNYARFKNEVREGSLKEILRLAHGPGHDKKFAYVDLDLVRIVRAGAGYLAANLDLPGSPVHTTVDSVIWYLLLINPFLDYAFGHPSGQQVLMLDWAEDEEVLNRDEPRSWEGFGQRAANSLSPLQQWHVASFVRSPGRAKLIGIHAPVLGPYPDWNDDELRRGEKTYRRGQDSRMRWPDGTVRRVERHTILAIRPKRAPLGTAADHGSIVRQRDWFIRQVGSSASGVRMVLSGHIHRFGLLVAYPSPRDREARHMASVTLEEVRGAGRGIAAVRREAGRVRAFPSPLYVNTTSAGPRGNVYGARGWQGVQPGWALVTVAPDGTIESISPRRLGIREDAPLPAPAREVARFLQPSRA
jgi:hypothetical protein